MELPYDEFIQAQRQRLALRGEQVTSFQLERIIWILIRSMEEQGVNDDEADFLYRVWDNLHREGHDFSLEQVCKFVEVSLVDDRGD